MNIPIALLNFLLKHKNLSLNILGTLILILVGGSSIYSILVTAALMGT